MTELPTVALLGTGTMGAGMARRIAGAGIPLRVWNRTRSRAEPLAAAGAVVADSAADAVRGADVVVTMLFDAESVEAAMTSAREGLAEGTVWLQQSTVGIEGADRLAAVAADLRLVYLDAPVLGTRQPAEDGKLVVLASGADEARSLVAPVLDAIGARTVWLGEAGQGSRLKLVANAWVLTVVEGISQSVRLAEALGLDPHAFLDAVRGGAMDAPYVQVKGSSMIDGDFTPSFALSGAAKDAGLILDAARAAGVDVPLLEAVQQRQGRALDAGHGDLDLSATHLAH